MGKFIGAFLIFICLVIIFGILTGVTILYIKALKKRKESNKLKNDYYKNNTKQIQELIELQKKQIEELQKQKENNQ